MPSEAFDPTSDPRHVTDNQSRVPAQTLAASRLPRLASFDGPDKNGLVTKVWTQKIPLGTVSFDGIDSFAILGGARTIWRKDRTVLCVTRLDISEAESWTKIEWRSRTKYGDITLPLEARVPASSRRDHLTKLVNAFTQGDVVDAWRILLGHCFAISPASTETFHTPDYSSFNPSTKQIPINPEVVSFAYRTVNDVRVVVAHPSITSVIKISQGLLPESALIPLSRGVLSTHSGTKRERTLVKNLLNRNISVRQRAYYEIAKATVAFPPSSLDRFNVHISGGERISWFRTAVQSMAPHFQLAPMSGSDTQHEAAIALAGRAQYVKLRSVNASRTFDSVTVYASSSGDLTLSFHLPADVSLSFVLLRSPATRPPVESLASLIEEIGTTGDIPWDLLRSLGAKVPKPDGTFQEIRGPLPWSTECEKWARAFERVFPSLTRQAIYGQYFVKSADSNIPGVTSSNNARIFLGAPGGRSLAEIKIAEDGQTEISVLGDLKSWAHEISYHFHGRTPLGQRERELLIRGLCKHPGIRGWFGRYKGLRTLEHAADEAQKALMLMPRRI